MSIPPHLIAAFSIKATIVAATAGWLLFEAYKTHKPNSHNVKG